ncbi:MAG: tetratricopeptide repeat protein [Pirellulales bacterium]|nr:tetratricopeptide repeat protein [Pirellulales bacterium]
MASAPYTAAMLAELVGVDVSRIRAWQRRGWLIAQNQTHRLWYFDFLEVTVARQLAELLSHGISPRSLGRKLSEIERRFPDVRRPLAELSLVLDGRTLLVRRGDELVEPGGQLRLDFESLDSDEEGELATLPSPGIFLSRPSPGESRAAGPQLAQWAAELDEAGDLAGAAEMYRSALAAAGPQPELCFQLAEVLYRAGDLAAARERYFVALELDEDYVEARLNLGCVLAELGERELAAAAFAGAIRSHEAYADAHYHLARTLDELGRADEARPHWQRFAELAPDSPWADEARERLQLAP